MNASELMLTVLASLVLPLPLLLRRWRRSPRVQRYRCQELVVNPDLTVTYRDAALEPCGREVRLSVHGDCVPLCPRHHKPMVQIV